MNNTANTDVRGRAVNENNLRRNEANRIVISSEEYVRFVRVKVIEVNFSVRQFIIDAVEEVFNGASDFLREHERT